MTNGQTKLSKPAVTASFEEYLKYYARRKGWSQSRLAVCARLNQSHINKIINGNVYNISVDVLTCISLALQLTLEESKDLLARTERAFSPASDQHQAYQELIAIYASPEYSFEEGNNMQSTVAAYNATIRTHIKPGLGAIRMDALDIHLVQSFYNGLREPTKERAAVSPKTVKNVHGILHKALQQAVANGYIRFNPTNSCILPRIEKKELQPLDEAETKLFLDAVKGHPLELLYTITLFTGLREGEALGLTWDRVDFMRGTILISKQLQKEKKAGG